MRGRLTRIAFGVARLAERAGWRRSRLWRLASRLGTRTLLRGPAQLPTSALAVEVEGLRLTLPRDSAFVYAGRDYEPGTRELLGALLGPGMTVVDVGANIGFLAAFAAQLVGAQGRVYAVEPSPGNLAFLRANLEANRLSQVEVLPVAAGSQSRRRILFLRPQGTLHSLFPAEPGAGRGELAVEERTLDELISSPVDLVKIDTEGAEIQVLHGMGRILAENPSLHLLVEWNRPGLEAAGHRFEELPDLLAERGFDLDLVDEKGGRHDSVEAVLEDLRRGRLSADWFANLHAHRGPWTPGR